MYLYVKKLLIHIYLYKLYLLHLKAAIYKKINKDYDELIFSS